ncbi:MAG: hypothetical protein R3D25_14635 [Geminicoccaceae bacterium]
MACAVRSILTSLLVLVLATMLAIEPARAHDGHTAVDVQATQHGAWEPLDQHDHGGAPHDRSCVSMIGHCGTMPAQDVAVALVLPMATQAAMLPPDGRAFVGRSPEADTPPPRV